MGIRTVLHSAEGLILKSFYCVLWLMIRLWNSGRLLGALTMQYLQHPGTTRVCENIGSHLLHYGRCIPLEEWEARISVGIHLFWSGYLSMVGVNIVWP